MTKLGTFTWTCNCGQSVQMPDCQPTIKPVTAWTNCSRCKCAVIIEWPEGLR